MSDITDREVRMAAPVEPRRTPYLHNLTARMRQVLIEHIPAPRPVVIAHPTYATLLSLNSRGFIRFDGRINPKTTRLTQTGHTLALACAALEADKLTDVENGR